MTIGSPIGSVASGVANACGTAPFSLPSSLIREPVSDLGASVGLTDPIEGRDALIGALSQPILDRATELSFGRRIGRVLTPKASSSSTSTIS